MNRVLRIGLTLCAAALVLMAAIAADPAMAAMPGNVASPPKLPAVVVARAPRHGLQPQVMRGRDGRLHLIYFTGDPGGGNLEYVVSSDDGKTYSAPLRVNSRPNTVIAVGNVRGGHLALGSAGTVDIAWVGPNDHGHVPMWFTRRLRGQAAFAPQRDLAPAMPLDGGQLAADGSGIVEVYWHGPPPNAKSEGQGEIWVARSSDGGRRFAPARPLWTHPTGACGCCGMGAAADRRGDFYVIYRSARALVHRDLYLLHSRDHGRHFQGTDFSPWKVGYCVMSTSQITETSAGLLAAWEQEGQVYFAPVSSSGRLDAPRPAPGVIPGRDMDRKYPAVAANHQGQVLLVWTEGMAWKRGGRLCWQLFSPAGAPIGAEGSATGVPPWDVPAVFAHPDGSFTLLY